jgi:hypothetical protein
MLKVPKKRTLIEFLDIDELGREGFSNIIARMLGCDGSFCF